MSGKKPRRVIWIGLALISFLGALCLPLGLPSVSQSVSPPTQTSTNRSLALELALTGQRQYQSQQFNEAASSWQQAAEAYEASGDLDGRQKSLINQSQALQNLGLYPKACRTLLQAFNAEGLDCDTANFSELVSGLSNQDASLSTVQSMGLQSLGDVLRQLGQLTSSKQVLELSLAIAMDSPAKTPSETGATLVSLGNTERVIGTQIRNRWDYEQVTDIINRQSPDVAIQTIQSALKAYQQVTADAPLTIQVQAHLNQLSLWLDLQDWWNRKIQERIESWQRLEDERLLQRAENFSNQLRATTSSQTAILTDSLVFELPQLPASRSTVFAQLNFAKNLMALKAVNGNEILATDSLNVTIKTTLQTALEYAQALGDRQSESYALGYFGQFYRDLGQWDLATQLTQKALAITYQLPNVREVSYQWQAQLGGLLEQQGDRKGALAAYTDAYRSLQALRSDLGASPQSVQFDFQQDVKPVYFALANLLLQSDQTETVALASQADVFPLRSSTHQTQNRLELARQVIESLQLAELDNFFQDPCSEVTDVPVQIDDIDPQAAVIYPMVFRDRMDLILSLPHQPLRYRSVAVPKHQVNHTLDELYDLLNNESIDTSAINIFRTIPLEAQEIETNLQQLLPIFSQLYDWLVRPIEAELRANSVKTLVFVLNDQLQRVPLAALYDGQRYLGEHYSVALAPSLQLINAKLPTRKRPKVLVAGVSQRAKIGNSNFPALVHVPEELNQIQEAFPNSRKLLDEDFTKQSLQRSLNQNYSIIHLATHGLFSSNPAQNFIVTGNQQRISIDDLSVLLKGQNAPQLLVLSACETATGDEQAILGLAGVAVRSGTSSTLATLWPVSDASTTRFMGQFYRALSKPNTQKNEALKIAQRSLLADLKRNPPFPELKNLPPHPYYWAPYVLVGSWL